MRFPRKDFEQLIACFKKISKEQSDLKRRYWLDWAAPYHGLPRSEFRKLFELYIVERGGDNGW